MSLTARFPGLKALDIYANGQTYYEKISRKDSSQMLPESHLS